MSEGTPWDQHDEIAEPIADGDTFLLDNKSIVADEDRIVEVPYETLRDQILGDGNDGQFTNLSLVAATELTIASDAITVTQSAHKLQPESSTADDLETISGGVEGDLLALYATDAGTDTITVKHGTGNISCPGGDDIALSEGGIFLYCTGAGWRVLGGGGGGGGDIDELQVALIAQVFG